GAEVARRGEADERVQIRAVDVNLAAMRMDNLANLVDTRLEHAMRRRIRHHDRGQDAGMLFYLTSEIADIDVAVRITGDDDDAHAGKLRGGGVGAMRGCGNQADVA